MKILYCLLTTILLIPTLTYADQIKLDIDPSRSNNSHVTSKKHIKHNKKEIKQESPNQEKTNNFKVSGYIDGSYNNLQRNYFTSGIFDRVFDNQQNGFTLHQVAITFAYQPAQGFGFLFNPILGYDTNIFAPYGFKPITEFDSQTFSIEAPQAFLQYAQNSFTFSAGRFVELAGAEGLFPIGDTNFSRGILYGYAEPFTVLGIRGTYVVNDKLTMIAGINNGWDNIRDWSRDKTIELNATYTMNSFFSFEPTIYTGQERATPQTDTGPKGRRTLIDLIATFNFTDKLSFIANYDGAWQNNAALPNGTIKRAIWQGIAGFINYKINDYWLTSFRGEIFQDKDGFRTGIKQVWKEATITLGYIPITNLEVRAEARHDFSNVNAFTDKNGVDTNNQDQSFALEAFYKFG